jgi:hypothetical protein
MRTVRISGIKLSHLSELVMRTVRISGMKVLSPDMRTVRTSGMKVSHLICTVRISRMKGDSPERVAPGLVSG